MEPHSKICARLDRAINADHGLSERLLALAGCLGEASAERGPGSDLEDLRRVCEAAASLQADGPTTGPSQCEVRSSCQAGTYEDRERGSCFAVRFLLLVPTGEVTDWCCAAESTGSGKGCHTEGVCEPGCPLGSLCPAIRRSHTAEGQPKPHHIVFMSVMHIRFD